MAAFVEPRQKIDGVSHAYQGFGYDGANVVRAASCARAIKELRPELRPLISPPEAMIRFLRKWARKIRSRLQDKRVGEIVRFLNHEAATTRRLLRFLIAESPAFQQSIAQTAGSFDDQWGNLPEGNSLLTNPEFDAGICDLVAGYTQLAPEWFAGKRVLDAGCGNGRFSVAFAQLGAEVTAFDQSAYGVESVRKFNRERNLNIDVHRLNVLQPLPFEPEFDLVWSFGVLHHTGDTFRAFQNVQALVRKGGYLFLMLYGEPRWEVTQDFVELSDYEQLRRATANRTLAEKIAILETDPRVTDLHGWFDAVSPSINDLYSFEEIEGWLLQSGFADIILTAERRNHHVIARKS